MHREKFYCLEKLVVDTLGAGHVEKNRSNNTNGIPGTAFCVRAQSAQVFALFASFSLPHRVSEVGGMMRL